MLIITLSGYTQSLLKTINLLPDTGVIGSYTTTFGEDNDYQINSPAYSDNGNGTVTDNVTSLMWQKLDGGEMTIENALIYVNTLTLGGYSDWRLPSPIESFSILNHQNNMPAINTTYFTSTTAEYWWTNTFQVGDSTKVWCTNSGGGIGNHPKIETISAGGTKHFHARAVRDAIPNTIISNRFTDNGDETVTDNLTQLIWQKTPFNLAKTWEEALNYSEGITLSGMSDWRLPNIKELQSLNDETVSNPSISQTTFPNIGTKNYWSSTTLPNQTTKAWYWNTQFGITTYDTKTNNNYVLCVKSSSAINYIEENAKNMNEILPNPFHSSLKLMNSKGNEHYTLTNVNGERLSEGVNLEIQDFSNLPKGTYFLQIDKHKPTTLIKE